MNKQDDAFWRIAPPPTEPSAERVLIRSFAVVSRSMLSFYLIDTDKNALREQAPIVYEFLKGAPMPLKADDGIY